MARRGMLVHGEESQMKYKFHINMLLFHLSSLGKDASIIMSTVVSLFAK